MSFQSKTSEILLVRPKALLTAIDRSFDRGTRGRDGGIDRGLPLLGLDDLAPNDPLDILLDEGATGQINGPGIVSKRIKFLLHPDDGFRIVIFPEEFVVHLPK